jgi:hypothetical protein
MSEYERVSATQKKDDISRSNQSQRIPLPRSSNSTDITHRERIYPQSLTHADVMQLQKTIGNRAVCQLMQELGLSNQSSKPAQREPSIIQMRIRENGELYEKDIEPRIAWGFSAQEIAAYNVINNADHPEITFASTEEMKTFVKRVVLFLDFFRTELSQLPSPIASGQVVETLARQSELNRNGHGLARHGPQMTLSALRDRLTTGFVEGEFCPAGAQGFATGFTSHDAFLVSQMTAIQHIQGAYNATANGLRPLVQNLKSRIRELDGLTGGSRGAKKKEIITANQNINEFVRNSLLNDPQRTGINMMPVQIDRTIYNIVKNLNHDQDGRVDELLLFFDRYKIVLANPEQIGRGLRVRDEELANPKANIVNPAFPLNGVPEPIFHARQLQSMGQIRNTATTVNPPNVRFVFNADISQWAVPQHFPDNGAPGWRA